MSNRDALIERAREIVLNEAQVLKRVAERVDHHLLYALEILQNCQGRVITTGMGKSGLVAQKFATTLRSLQIRAFYLHPSEALHGDLGCLASDDVLVVFSKSGETREVRAVVVFAKARRIQVVVITCASESTLGAYGDVVLDLGEFSEAGYPLLAPTSSTTAMLAVGDALALVMAEEGGVTPADFKFTHPA